jgi:hypothetical protein
MAERQEVLLQAISARWPAIGSDSGSDAEVAGDPACFLYLRHQNSPASFMILQCERKKNIGVANANHKLFSIFGEALRKRFLIGK